MSITSSAVRELIAKKTIQEVRRIIVHKKLDMLLLVTLSNGFQKGSLWSSLSTFAIAHFYWNGIA